MAIQLEFTTLLFSIVYRHRFSKFMDMMPIVMLFINVLIFSDFSIIRKYRFLSSLTAISGDVKKSLFYMEIIEILALNCPIMLNYTLTIKLSIAISPDLVN